MPSALALANKFPPANCLPLTQQWTLSRRRKSTPQSSAPPSGRICSSLPWPRAKRLACKPVRRFSVGHEPHSQTLISCSYPQSARRLLPQVRLQDRPSGLGPVRGAVHAQLRGPLHGRQRRGAEAPGEHAGAVRDDACARREADIQTNISGQAQKSCKNEFKNSCMIPLGLHHSYSYSLRFFFSARLLPLKCFFPPDICILTSSGSKPFSSATMVRILRPVSCFSRPCSEY